MARGIDIVATTIAMQRKLGLMADQQFIPKMIADERGADYIAGIAKTLGNQLWGGIPYYLDRDVMPQLVEAARDVPDVAVFTPDMFPSDVGFVALARPWPIVFSEGVGDVTALSWEFISTAGPNPMTALALAAFMDDGEKVKFFIGAEPLGKPIGEFKRGMDATNALYALFAFLKKRILVAARTASATRAQRRAAQWTDPPEVFVIIYRKTQNRQRESGDSGPVDWSCRWLSRQHWGIRYHVQGDQRVPVVTLISASIKGPVGKPMRVSPKTLGAIVR